MTIGLVISNNEEPLPNGHPNIEKRQSLEEEEQPVIVLDKLAAHISSQWETNKRDKRRFNLH